MTLLPRTDVHQHLWPPALLAALADRGAGPDDEALLRANPPRLLG
jgi:hypothetical protein